MKNCEMMSEKKEKVLHPVTGVDTKVVAHDYESSGDKLVFRSRFAIPFEGREKFLENVKELKETLLERQKSDRNRFEQHHANLDVKIYHSLKPLTAKHEHSDGPFFLLLFSTEISHKGLSRIQLKDLLLKFKRYHFLARNDYVKKFVKDFNAEYKLKQPRKEEQKPPRFQLGKLLGRLYRK